MAGLKSVYICTNCGASSNKWLGKCPNCGEWNSFVEEIVEKQNQSSRSKSEGIVKKVSTQRLDEISTDAQTRYTTGIGELDRVLGGGIVGGSVVLLGGEPGAGKSTLLLQMCGHMCDFARILYVTGEESAHQIKLRASRLNVDSSNISIATETDVFSIMSLISELRPDLAVIDSIQTITSTEMPSAAGSVTQVRECTSLLTQMAKGEEIPLFIVGHVNKDGAIAGPKVMEHIVDTVLLFEGDRYLSYRILRAVKNRFGSTNEIGIFEMGAKGLEEIQNPSSLFLDGRDEAVSGSCVTCVMEGSRAVLSEIQSLVAKTGFGTPRRTSSGFDYNRTNLLLAVLEKRAGYFFSNLDVYINVIGGIQMNEPAADLAVAVSLVSAVLDRPVPTGIAAFGEIGLGGEVRACGNTIQRINESVRLGYNRCILAKSALPKINVKDVDASLVGISNVREIAKLFDAER
ncbi:MAG: DNA repair protein RadA [Oscillospiraceae bacterium]